MPTSAASGNVRPVAMCHPVATTGGAGEVDDDVVRVALVVELVDQVVGGDEERFAGDGVDDLLAVGVDTPETLARWATRLAKMTIAAMEPTSAARRCAPAWRRPRASRERCAAAFSDFVASLRLPGIPTRR